MTSQNDYLCQEDQENSVLPGTITHQTMPICLLSIEFPPAISAMAKRLLRPLVLHICRASSISIMDESWSQSADNCLVVTLESPTELLIRMSLIAVKTERYSSLNWETVPLTTLPRELESVLDGLRLLRLPASAVLKTLTLRYSYPTIALSDAFMLKVVRFHQRTLDWSTSGSGGTPDVVSPGESVRSILKSTPSRSTNGGTAIQANESLSSMMLTRPMEPGLEDCLSNGPTTTPLSQRSRGDLSTADHLSVASPLSMNLEMCSPSPSRSRHFPGGLPPYTSPDNKGCSSNQ